MVEQERITPEEIKKLEAVRTWSTKIGGAGGVESGILALTSAVKGDARLAVLAVVALSVGIFAARRFDQADNKLEKSGD